MSTTDRALEQVADKGVEKYTKIVNNLRKQLKETPNDEKLKTSLTQAENMLTTFIENMDKKSWEKVEKEGDDSDGEDWEAAKKNEGGRRKSRRRRNRKSRRRRRKTQYKRK
jgi:hypothetical protein